MRVRGARAAREVDAESTLGHTCLASREHLTSLADDVGHEQHRQIEPPTRSERLECGREFAGPLQERRRIHGLHLRDTDGRLPLSALMQLQWREVGLFAAVLLPFAALMAALNMLAATFGRSFKEAQTYVSYIAMAAQFSALVPVFLTVRDAAWQLWVPSVAQLTVLMKVLRGEPLSAAHLLLPAAVCLAATLACLWLQARLLRRESIVFSRG